MTQLNYKYNDIKKIEIQLKNENKQLSKDIDDMKDKETQLIKRNYELNNDINNLKFEIRQLKKFKEDNKDKDDKLVNEKTQIMNDTNDVIDEEDQSINQKAQIIKDNNLFKKDVNLLIKENKQLIKDINDINDIRDEDIKKDKKNTQIINDINFLKNQFEQIKNEDNQKINNEKQSKNENIQLKNNESPLKNENNQFKNENSNFIKEVNELKEKLNILWKEKIMIKYLDSKIINGNEKYNETLKYWINPSKKIKAELLYRLSENGDKYSTFHELCDNKGPTLTLFHVNDGNIVGIYTPLSWDSPFFGKGWKDDKETFIFNLNKNKRCKILKDDHSIYCSSSYGPWTACFGARNSNYSMRKITHKANFINKFYDNGSEILPSNNNEVIYDLIELEIYKIIIK